MSSLKNFELDYKALKKSSTKNSKNYLGSTIDYSYNIKGTGKLEKKSSKPAEKKHTTSGYNPEYIDQRGSHNNKNSRKVYNKRCHKSGSIISKIIAQTSYGLLFLGIVGFLFFLTIFSGFAKSKNIEDENSTTFENHIEDIKNGDTIYLDSDYAEQKASNKNSGDRIAHRDRSMEESVLPINYTKYRIKEDDTLESIAKQHNLNVDSVILSNNMKRDLLKVGSIISVPNQNGRVITLKETESIYTLAKKYSVKAEDIAYANDLRAEKISSGTKIFIPFSKMSKAERESFYGTEGESGVAVESIEREFNVIQTWPLKGQITSHFGNREDPFNSGTKKLHDGIDIKNKRGTPVCAFRDGVVEEVVQDDPVYGNYVLLKHKNGYMSKYAHLNETMVEEGSIVRTTQVIGTVGSTGRSTGDHLHFEVIRNGAFVDPLLVLN